MFYTRIYCITCRHPKRIIPIEITTYSAVVSLLIISGYSFSTLNSLMCYIVHPDVRVSDNNSYLTTLRTNLKPSYRYERTLTKRR